MTASVMRNPADNPLRSTPRAPIAAGVAPLPQVVETPITLTTTSGAFFGQAGGGQVTGAPVDLARGAAPGKAPAGAAPGNNTAPSAGRRAPSLPRSPGGTTTDFPEDRASTPPGVGGGDGAPTPATPAKPAVNASVSIKLGPSAAGGVSVGQGDGSCTGAAAGSVSNGCKPPPASAGTAGVSVVTDGTAAGGVLANRAYNVGL
jgi:hypothetical protein